MSNQKKSPKKRFTYEGEHKQKINQFHRQLLNWFEREGRDLPWRRTRDPYKILISEIMLQQTNVEIVIPIYNQFLIEFPTLQTLAQAPLKKVKSITDQLGYKRRGEYLHNIAKQIFFERKGEFPSSLEDLLKLKGIGRYTAGAILSFAYEKEDKTSAIVDVNVERVLGRVFGLWHWDKNAKFDKQIWELSETLISIGNVWTTNQGILDLGAMICTAKKPKCSICPMTEICMFYETEVPKIASLDSFFSLNTNTNPKKEKNTYS
ncbi:MAG: A/G-specific adenine glycosylase [Candidatus Hodarchaeota archaeon]